MNTQRRFGKVCGFGASVAMLTMFGVSAHAQQQGTVEGMIVGRDGANMYVKTGDSQRQIVTLTDSTKATEKGGLFGWSHKNLGITELVPGLNVKVEGTYDTNHQLTANKVEFTSGSMRTARQIDAGLNPVNEKMAKQQDAIMSARRDIEQTQQDIASAKTDIANANTKIDATAQAATEANNATNGRIGQLDQYDTKDSYTVNFKNGSATVSQKDKDGLADFLKQAAAQQGFMIEVQGYASKVGNPSLNQKLSSERAENVITLIQQSGAVPLTRILAPAAMGVSEQPGDNHTRAGQAQNRRVVVTVVVNRGITSGQNQQATNSTEQTPQQPATTPQQ